MGLPPCLVLGPPGVFLPALPALHRPAQPFDQRPACCPACCLGCPPCRAPAHAQHGGGAHRRVCCQPGQEHQRRRAQRAGGRAGPGRRQRAGLRQGHRMVKADVGFAAPLLGGLRLGLAAAPARLARPPRATAPRHPTPLLPRRRCPASCGTWTASTSGTCPWTAGSPTAQASTPLLIDGRGRPAAPATALRQAWLRAPSRAGAAGWRAAPPTARPA